MFPPTAVLASLRSAVVIHLIRNGKPFVASRFEHAHQQSIRLISLPPTNKVIYLTSANWH